MLDAPSVLCPAFCPEAHFPGALVSEATLDFRDLHLGLGMGCRQRQLSFNAHLQHLS